MKEIKVIISKALADAVKKLGDFTSINDLIIEVLKIYLYEVSIVFKPYYIYVENFINTPCTFKDIHDLLIEKYSKELGKRQLKAVDKVFNGIQDNYFSFKANSNNSYLVHLRLNASEYDCFRLQLSAFTRTSGARVNLTIKFMISLLLEFMVYYLQAPDKFNYRCGKIFQLKGNKWHPKMISSVHRIVSDTEPRYLVDCFGGVLGLTMNISAKNYIINDLDLDRINLYLCIQNDRALLLSKILKYNFTAKDFAELNVNPKKLTRTKQGIVQPNYNAAASYFIRMCLCKRDTINSIGEAPRKPHNAAVHADYILYYYEKLQSATIVSMDVFDLLKWVSTQLAPKDMNDTLIALDPPYYNVSNYKNSIDYKGAIRSKSFVRSSVHFLELWIAAASQETIVFENSPELHRYMIERVYDMGAKFLYFYRDLKEMNNVLCSDRYYYLDSFYLTGNGVKKERIITNLRKESQKLRLPTTSSLPIKEISVSVFRKKKISEDKDTKNIKYKKKKRTYRLVRNMKIFSNHILMPKATVSSLKKNFKKRK